MQIGFETALRLNVETVLPLAIASAGWAVIGALGGALVGAAAGGVVDAILEGRRESRLARAGARLVAGDISMVGSQLETVEKEGKWWRFMEAPTANWLEYQGVLAGKLSNKDFETVSQAVHVFREIFDKIPAAPTWPEGAGVMTLPKGTIEGLAGPITEAADAYNALADLAGHNQVGGRIHSPT